MKTIIALFILLSLGCTRISYHIIEGKIEKIESSGSIALGQNDTITVTFTGGVNSCASPDHLKTDIRGNTIVFWAYYKYPRKNDICLQAMPVHQLKYIYKPKKNGIYFYEGANSSHSCTSEVH